MEADKTDGATSGGITGHGGNEPEGTSGSAQSSSDTATSQGEGDTHDEFGYEVSPETKGKKDEGAEGDKKPEQAATATKEADAVTGYGDEPPPKPAAAAAPPAEKTDDGLGYDVDSKGLPDDEMPKLREFLKANKMSKEQGEAIAQNRREFYAAQAQSQTDFAAAQKTEEARIKAGWDTELRNDPTFGGENFRKNVKAVDKLVEEFMPGMKKMLTERKSMLPPYLMRDLLSMSQKLHGSAAFVQGNPGAPKEDAQLSDDDLLKEMYK